MSYFWTSKLFTACMHAQGDKYCFSHRFFHPYMGSTLFLRGLGVTDVFPRIFMWTEMNSDMELNQISVDIVTLTQDVSTSPISLVLFIRLHKNRAIRHDWQPSSAEIKASAIWKVPQRADQGPAADCILWRRRASACFSPRRWAPIYELLTWMKQGFKTE